MNRRDLLKAVVAAPLAWMLPGGDGVVKVPTANDYPPYWVNHTFTYKPEAVVKFRLAEKLLRGKSAKARRV